ncbi:conserved hypothetical protein [Histoplasma mississippiense (nom. inval.)]|uniref:conserved hypothetical protein n=1 Tax=Ajellomyces capsulatus (strain NAm1 / WU24) TaxID=2059318 RepID=UPI000157BEFF|nr:conserved hypothetical protein [Histoplasma mississippiense (nom. inval.)]EDN06754.1 conserved hypothetical protein [Histoplasma mississippiense (nom. inval.)]
MSGTINRRLSKRKIKLTRKSAIVSAPCEEASGSPRMASPLDGRNDYTHRTTAAAGKSFACGRRGLDGGDKMGSIAVDWEVGILRLIKTGTSALSRRQKGFPEISFNLLTTVTQQRVNYDFSCATTNL